MKLEAAVKTCSGQHAEDADRPARDDTPLLKADQHRDRRKYKNQESKIHTSQEGIGKIEFTMAPSHRRRDQHEGEVAEERRGEVIEQAVRSERILARIPEVVPDKGAVLD